ncbi:MAG: hypothetical protein KJ726_03450 [Verrucomicrobia bacterium]|nr:hypothetical protein [Verrucomicrobiota bacterium]
MPKPLAASKRAFATVCRLAPRRLCGHYLDRHVDESLAVVRGAAWLCDVIIEDDDENEDEKEKTG